ncbi:transcriptional regulator NrdR [bacterium]|nr:transcriptional regulator NrdR [bacterium]MBU1291074.1 transcriptional regulator NrdR [bacterium]MBU1428195.1 transcriptional regulator NrdR [bacterium]MBU2440214.1 transcriptional regulator NrdR [bacterium]MBU4561891.1 transcriptional regulator NrdR [bacterium]
MKCPYCGYYDTGVIESRHIENGLVVRRRRICKKCNKRFTTYERIGLIPLMVIKKDGRREPFSREKITNGIIKACEKRPISIETINNLVNNIEEIIKSEGVDEIKSNLIGELVISRLRDLDEVAYVRFASVYRQFKDLSSFVKEIRKITK